MEKFNARETWWYKYRRAKNRPRRQKSFEMILRSSFKKVFMEYVKHCSFWSVKEMFERDVSLQQRFIRFIFFVATIGTVIYFLQYLWSDTLTKPLIVTMDSSTYPISEIDFPAIAVCNINRISLKAVKIMAREIKKLPSTRNESLLDIEWFVLQAGRLLDYAYNETLRNHRLLNSFDRSRVDTHVIIEWMKQLSPDCEEMLVRCSWGGKYVNCSSIFTVRRTARGHCCAFNYVLDYNSIGKPNKAMGHVMRQKRPGMSFGLNMVLNPLLDDYAYPLRNVNGFDVFFFDPTHFADPSGGRVVQRVAEPNELSIFELQSTKQIATEEVKKYPLSTRKCLFHDERPESFGEMYSYSACIVRCRIKSILSLCKCTPYFLPTSTTDAPICTLDNLQCLNKYKEKLLYMFPEGAASSKGLETEMQDSLYCPDCLPDCEFTRHSTKSSTVPLKITKHTEKQIFFSFVHDINLTNMCMVSIFQSTADGVLDRLDVVAYWFEILSNIGGFAGMLVGFSIISFAEIIYYFIVRFIMVIWANCKSYY